MRDLGGEAIEELLGAVGDLLTGAGVSVALVVVGGATLNVRGFVPRVTRDVDVIAQAELDGGAWTLSPPTPFPEALSRAVARVARDFRIANDWLNAAIGSQWSLGLPGAFAEDIEWRHYGNLTVGYVGRAALIALKLIAAVDQTPSSVHFQDLCALGPSDEELAVAAAWVASQDAGPEFPEQLRLVVERCRADR